MAAKSANLYAKIDPEVKEQAEGILSVLDMSVLSEEQINDELEKGYTDMKSGCTKSVSKAFADIRKDYHL